MADTEKSHPSSQDLSEDDFDLMKPDPPFTDETAPQVGPEDFGRLRRDPVTEDTVDGVSRTFTPTFGPQIWFPPSSSIDTKGFRNPDGPRKRVRQTPMLQILHGGASNRQGPSNARGNGNHKRRNESPETGELVEAGRSKNKPKGRKRKEVEENKRANDDLYGASPPRRQQDQDSDAQEFDRLFPPRLVRRLRTWAGPVRYVGLSPLERSNMLNSPGPRKRTKI